MKADTGKPDYTLVPPQVIDALDAICERECEYSKPQRAVMCGACRLGSAFDAVYELPTAERKKGRWVLVKGSNGKDYHKCSQCLHTQEITGVKNYCAVCGAEMVNSDE